MRARPLSQPFDSSDYLFETRWGGIRTLATIANGQARLHNRRLGDLTGRFPELALLAYAAADQPLMLDGEIVIVDEHGHPDFDTPQWRLRLVDEDLIHKDALRKPACYLASDLLFRGQRWLLSEPLERRKRALNDALHQAECLYRAEYFESEGRALFGAAADSQLEGVVAKPRDGLYTPGGYGGGWLTIGREREELVVGGYSMQIAGRSRTIELLLGCYDPTGHLVFETAAELPADEQLRTELFRVLNALQIDQSPFTPVPPFIACWVRPELVVSVTFGGDPERSDPVFERVRLDVSPDECLLHAGTPAQHAPARAERPQLTMLTTLPLPLDRVPSSEPAIRPALRLVEEL